MIPKKAPKRPINNFDFAGSAFVNRCANTNQYNPSKNPNSSIGFRFLSFQFTSDTAPWKFPLCQSGTL